MSSQNLKIEEEFCRAFAENNALRLVFEHYNSPHTNGDTIYNDPQFLEIYSDNALLLAIERKLNLGDKLSTNCWNALKMVTRALSIHECLHILYTDFSINIAGDIRCCGSGNKYRILVDIFNIIEDSFIENYGASVYDNIIGYLKFIRMATASRLPNSVKNKIKDKNYINLTDYMDYMCKFVLYSPFMTLENKNPEIENYIAQTKDLFLTGTVQGSCKRRYEYAQKIFDIIQPMIPDDKDILLDDTAYRDKMRTTIICRSSYFTNPPKNVDNDCITRRLFTGLNGEDIPNDHENTTAEILLDFIDYDGDYKRVNRTKTKGDISVVITPKEYGLKNAFRHNDIEIHLTKLAPHTSYKVQYDEIVSQYKSTINTYKARIFDLLQAKAEVRVDKMIFGHGISSKHLGDVKGRFWFKKTYGIDTPPLSVLFLIDGSGSMYGKNIENAKIASVIMYEVLSVNNIEHCFVLHNAYGICPKIGINVLVDFDSDVLSKYNIMTVGCDGDNRDSLALLWAEKYLSDNASNENKVIIIISDGLPAHGYDKYFPPASTRDTAETVSRIINRGIHIAAVALGEKNYAELKEIYPRIVCCSDLKRLPGMLVGVIAKMLE
ncbi:MAG: VWA domain-containing protein [Bacteroidales bacterium]|nr:VWA domain-containing protein [Bacteroidales bacterium]